MIGRGAARAVASLLLVAVVGGAPADAASAIPDDGTGTRWRQLTETTGLTSDQVAEVCPRDGLTPCSGVAGAKDLTGWVWATDVQVVSLMGRYDPAILTADPPSVSGPEHLGPAMDFLTDMRPTFSVTGYNFHHSSAGGWTSSTDEAGQPIAGFVGFGWYPIGGGFTVGPTAEGASAQIGVWLWRPASDDITPPTITPIVSGTSGSNGWYVSDTSVTWNVGDAESELSSQSGCDVTTISADTASTTLTCSATSAGGTSNASVVVKRDTTAPTVTCQTPPQVFAILQLGAWVTAAVTDETSGPASPIAQGITNTNTPGTFTSVVTGTDRAGHRTTRTCAYQVVIPACGGLTPTIVGTAQNNIINGTSGPDVILALSGADTVRGLGGDDVICGGDGPDTIDGGDGNDWIDGGASPDDLTGGNGDDFLDGGLHNDSLHGGNGTDTCISGETRTSSCER